MKRNLQTTRQDKWTTQKNMTRNENTFFNNKESKQLLI